MSKESIERTVKVFVPKGLYEKFVSEGANDPVGKYIAEISADDVVGYLCDDGVIDPKQGIKTVVKFVPDPRDTEEEDPARYVKIIEVFRDKDGHVSNALAQWRKIVISSDYANYQN